MHSYISYMVLGDPKEDNSPIFLGHHKNFYMASKPGISFRR